MIADCSPGAVHSSGGKAHIARGFFALALFLISVGAARADLRIVSSSGGEVGSFLQLFAMIRQSGQRVIIDGPCISACTLVLSAIPEDRICVTRRAILGFHAARWRDRQGQFYAAPVRAWIERNGGLTGKPIFLRSRQLAALYPPCQ